MTVPKIPENAHWRDSARKIRFFGMDVRIAFLLFFFLIHIRFWTFFVVLFGICFLTLVDYYGFSLVVFGRCIRGILAGPRKVSVPWWKQ